MSYCNGLIQQNIEQDCKNPLVPGMEQEGIIINRRDIDFGKTTFDDERENVIKELVLKAGAKAYRVQIPTNQPFSGTSTTLETGTVRNSFTHNVGMLILNNDPDVCHKVIDSLATGKFVCVLENKFKNISKATNPGDSSFQVYGYYQGLQASTLENDKYSEDTEGGWNVVLTETKTPKSALFFYNQDLDTSKQLLDSLTAENAD